jgi:hypothetical protein
MWVIYIATYLASQVWLSGSLLIPIMLLVRWGAAKWKGLRILAISRKRWILIWGCYGAMEVALLSALVLYLRHRESFDVLPFDFLGWAWMVVGGVFYALHIASGDAIQFALGLTLKVVGEAAIDAGLAAIAWWTYGVLTHGVALQRRTKRYGVCLLLAACGLGIANNSYFWHSWCADCFAPHEIPFTYFHEGGYAGGEGFVWVGVLGNSIVVLIAGLALGLMWNRLAARTPE